MGKTQATRMNAASAHFRKCCDRTFLASIDARGPIFTNERSPACVSRRDGKYAGEPPEAARDSAGRL
jgi:hypothetical protein